jgi:hypothetical protein
MKTAYYFAGSFPGAGSAREPNPYVDGALRHYGAPAPRKFQFGRRQGSMVADVHDWLRTMQTSGLSEPEWHECRFAAA